MLPVIIRRIFGGGHSGNAREGGEHEMAGSEELAFFGLTIKDHQDLAGLRART
jgi:hypothetical protein